jgi:hypothetical protein
LLDFAVACMTAIVALSGRRAIFKKVPDFRALAPRKNFGT